MLLFVIQLEIQDSSIRCRDALARYAETRLCARIFRLEHSSAAGKSYLGEFEADARKAAPALEISPR
jgi:hypothetical protein